MNKKEIEKDYNILKEKVKALYEGRSILDIPADELGLIFKKIGLLFLEDIIFLLCRPDLTVYYRISLMQLFFATTGVEFYSLLPQGKIENKYHMLIEYTEARSGEIVEKGEELKQITDDSPKV